MIKFRSLHWFIKFSIFFFIFILILIFLSLLNWILPIKIVSNSEVRGLVFGNQIWKGNIWISGDTFVLPGTVVTLAPGTKVLISGFGDKNNYDFLPWHLRSGVNTADTNHGIFKGEPFWDESSKVQVRFWKVLAKGTKEQPVTISSDNQSDNIYDINLIRIEKGKLEGVNFSNYRRLEIGQNVLIKNSNFNFTGECAVCISRGTPTIEHNTFRNGKRFFIDIGLASPYIKGNNFFESEGDGIIYDAIDQSEVKLVENTFQIPGKKAVIVGSNNIGGRILQNLFNQGDIEIPCYSKIRIESNYLKNKIIFRNSESCKGEFIIGENFWDTLDIDSVINTKFIGQTQNFRVIVPSILMKSPLN